MLSEDEVATNAATYLEQAGRVVDVGRAEIHGNAEWSASMDMGQLLRLASTATVAQMLEREDFRARHRDGRPISVVEFLYPLFQGYDSVAIEADVELGGTDQTFNLLMGREVQRAYGLAPQVVMTLPLLEGTDGVRKMSKSYDNWIGLTEPSDDMFGKLMSIPDPLVVSYLRLCTALAPEQVDAIDAGLRDGSLAIVEQKRRLACEVVDLYHGRGAGAAAEEAFNRVHRDRELPEVVEDMPIPPEAAVDGVIWLPRLLVALGWASSNGEARRLVTQGGVRLDGEVIMDPDHEAPEGTYRGKVLQVGRRWFGRLA